MPTTLPSGLILSDEEDIFPDLPVCTDQPIENDDAVFEIDDGEGDPSVPFGALSDDLDLDRLTRLGSDDKSVHRSLKRGNTGADVEALQRATHRRLEARSISRDIKFDGLLGNQTLKAVDTALTYLGALTGTVDQPSVSIGAQAMIRHPGVRNEDQLKRARDRMEKLLKEREHQAHQQHPTRPGQLSDAQVVQTRYLAAKAFGLLYSHAGSVHYTQSGLRWQGINRGLRSSRGQYPNYADCSSAVTWAWWNALTHSLGDGAPDIINGQSWRAGFTGTIATHGVRVSTLTVGTLILYGFGWPHHHVTMYVGGGMCLSHGSEAGPFKLPVHYRADYSQARKML